MDKDDGSTEHEKKDEADRYTQSLHDQDDTSSALSMQRLSNGVEDVGGDGADEEADGTPKYFPNIDLLYDYQLFLRNTARQGRIGQFPRRSRLPKVAVIGSGISGLIVASELLRAGIKDLTIYESRDRIGGKLWAHQFKGSPIFAEMGGMRFPSSETCLYWYLQRHKITHYGVFPNADSADVMLLYKGEKHLWNRGSDPPQLFQKVHTGWQDLLRNGFTAKGVHLAGPLAIKRCLQLGHLQQAKYFWQCWLDSFSHESFSSGIERIFTSDRPPGGESWLPHDFDLFQALGPGTGGLGPVSENGFLEILRIIVNGYGDNTQFLLQGTSALLNAIVSQVIDGICLRDQVCFNTVTRIERKGSRIRLMLENEQAQFFDRVVVTSGFHSMQVKHQLTSNPALLGHEVRHAIEQSHVTIASKLFILTQTKFWLEHNIPPCILTTGVAKETFCFDYEPQNPQGKGLVLLSYTWESDSQKLLSIQDKRTRLEVIRRDFANTFPQFAAHLFPADGDYDNNVIQHDWLTDPHSRGAFKLNRRGEEALSKELFFQPFHQSSQDKGIYLAGCGCSFTGGWVEGAIQTALNAACAVIYDSGGSLTKDNPLQHDWCRYDYGK